MGIVIKKKKRLLNLEGFNKRYGWHGYLLYNKLKIDKIFSHHFIRKNLLDVWLKYSRRLDPKRPLWLSPLEIDCPSSHSRDQNYTFQDFIKSDRGNYELKQLQDLSIPIDWFQYMQIKNLYEKDKKNYGFRGKYSSLEEIIIENQPKSISKIYKLLLSWFTEDEVVKHSMVKWAKNCSRSIDMSSWEVLWKSTQKMVIAAKIKKKC